ncbi:MAG: cytochrome c [Myxococcales bacterium]|nr:cytochrome c [Myxococcales bacterium]
MSASRTVLLGAVLTALAACDSPPADLREWRPSDHSNAGSGEDPGGGRAPSDPLANARALWVSQCVACHGREGRGDGTQTMVRPPDMSAVAFQDSHTDEQLATSILRGKSGTMPSFASLRPEAVQSLVRLVRSFGGR